MDGINLVKETRCQVKSLKLLTRRRNPAVKPLSRILGTSFQSLIMERYLLRVYDRWSILSLFFLEEYLSAASQILVNQTHISKPEIIFDILAKSKSTKAVIDKKGYYSFRVINPKVETGPKLNQTRFITQEHIPRVKRPPDGFEQIQISSEAVSLILSNSAINKLARNYIEVKPTQYLDNRREDSAGEAPTIYREAGTASSPERTWETRWNNYISRITAAYSIRPWPEAVSLILSNSAINKLASNYIEVKPSQYLDNRREDSREDPAGEAPTIYREAGTASPERTRETRWNNYISRITAAYSIRPWPEAVSLLLSNSAINKLASNYIEVKPS
ncbi:MAG: hypothetical protein PHU78_02260, partial [Heliobacteriaceae bacterium]|nr:hypothetical protein [Heliobacteriaceae bacterium]